MKQNPFDSGLKEFPKRAWSSKSRPALRRTVTHSPTKIWALQAGSYVRGVCHPPSSVPAPCFFSAPAFCQLVNLVVPSGPHGNCPHPTCRYNPVRLLGCSHKGLHAILAIPTPGQTIRWDLCSRSSAWKLSPR